jgi:hypothetical protein
MSKQGEPGTLAKTSFWLAQTFGHVVQLHAGLVAIEPASRARSERINLARIFDAEDRFALALEGFGEVIRNGDGARVEKLIAELEVPNGASKRRHARWPYQDLIRKREDHRYMRRRLERLRERLEQMTATGSPARERRPLRSEVRVLEEILGEPFSEERPNSVGRAKLGRPRSAAAGQTPALASPPHRSVARDTATP